MNAETRLARIEEGIDKEVAKGMAVRSGGVAFASASEVMEYAKMMAVSGSAVPKHLRGQPGACLGIIDDALRYEMSPFSLARKSYFVNDNLAYEAQVLAAIVLARAPLAERPDITFSGEGAQRQCTVTYHFNDGSVREYRSPAIGQIHPKNSPLWKSDPDQQLSYFSLRAGARRHCPDVLMGIYDREEMAISQMRDVTPHAPRQSLKEAMEATPQTAPSGFYSQSIDAETGGSEEPEDAEFEPADYAADGMPDWYANGELLTGSSEETDRAVEP